MKKLLLKHGVLAGVLVLTVMISIPIAVGAISTDNNTDGGEQTTTQGRKAKVLENLSDKKDEIRTRLADKKLEICRKREENINNIMSRISDRGTKQLAVFTKISDRVQAFYVEKGNILDNYDALVAEVNTTKTAAEAAVADVKSTSVTFTCDGTDPKGTIDTFKTKIQAQRAALKA